ncbi:MAG: hypothetical protein GY862_28165 [Gammaproteobacteria bacterium]|nr:hypothetical protein [Gammaproteobacteria bacterium]
MWIFTLDNNSIEAIWERFSYGANEARLDLDSGVLTLPLVEVESPDGLMLRYRATMRMVAEDPMQFTLDLQDVVPMQ